MTFTEQGVAIYTCIGVCLTTIVLQCQGFCFDIPSFNIIGPDGVAYSDCSSMVANAPQYCKLVVNGTNGAVFNVSRICCDSCSAVPAAAVPCEDASWFVGTLANDQTYTCPLIASHIPQYCNTNVTIRGEIQLVRIYCCASCAAIPTSTCMDSLFTLTLNNVTRDCHQIASDLPSYCTKQVTGRNGNTYDIAHECCASCNQGLCVDSPNFYLTGPDFVTRNCSGIAKSTPQYCSLVINGTGGVINVTAKCCASCKPAVAASSVDALSLTLSIIADDADPCVDDVKFTINIGTVAKPKNKTCAQIKAAWRFKLCCQGRSGTSGNGAIILGKWGCCAICAAYRCP